MSILGGFLPPVHGTVYRQAQPQVTLSLPTWVQVNGSGAVLSPSSVAIPQASSSQGMPFESVLPPHFLETLVAKVAEEGSHRFSTVLPAQPTTPASSQLTEVAVCMLIFKHLDVHLCLTFHQWTRPHQFLRFS